MYDTTASFKEKELFARIIEKLKPDTVEENSYPNKNGVFSRICPFCKSEYSKFIFDKDRFDCRFCGQRGSIYELGRLLGILDENDEIADFQGISLKKYAEITHLQIDYLKMIGLAERNFSGKPRVLIPYIDEGGNIIGTRYRLNLDGQFMWKSGSKVIPYGLWKIKELLQYCNEKLGHSGLIFIVTDEVEAQIFWFYGIPALSVPKGVNWKKEWNEKLEDNSIYFLGDLTIIEQNFPDLIETRSNQIFIATLPENRKILIDCHKCEDSFLEIIFAMINDAVPISEIIREKKVAEEKELFKLAESGLKGDLLASISKYCDENSITGELHIVKLIYLILTTRVLEKPTSLIIKGPSSAGKSYLLNQVLKLFPKSSYYELSSMSEKALIYSKESLQHRILIIFESTGLNSDFLSYILRSLLSEGRIKYETVEKIDDGMVSRFIEKEGPTGLITTTTARNLHPENETRMLSVEIRDDPEQTKNIMLEIAKEAEGKENKSQSIDKYIAVQTWIEKYGCHDVVIPFAKIIVQLIQPTAIRLRRDVTTLFQLIKANAILNQFTRKKDDSGRITADLEDYKVVYELIATIFSEGIEKTINPVIRETVEVVRLLLNSEDLESDEEYFFPKLRNNSQKQAGNKETKLKEIDLPSIALALNVDRSTASRRVNKAIEMEFLINLETRKGQRARIILGRPLPEDVQILPTPEQLKKAMDPPEE